MKIYEGVFLTKANLDSEERAGLFQKLESIISEGDGKILKRDEWGRKRLAYEIKKENEAHYTYLEFTATKDAMDEMKRVMKINDNFLRHMFIKKED